MRKNLHDVRDTRKSIAHAQQQGFGPFRQRSKRLQTSDLIAAKKQKEKEKCQ